MEDINLFPVLQRFITSGGTIDVGRIDVIGCAAVASDSDTLWAILMRREGESFLGLLRRLEGTLERCLARNELVDELEDGSLQ
jgi:hypothetical protein